MGPMASWVSNILNFISCLSETSHRIGVRSISAFGWARGHFPSLLRREAVTLVMEAGCLLSPVPQLPPSNDLTNLENPKVPLPHHFAVSLTSNSKNI